MLRFGGSYLRGERSYVRGGEKYVRGGETCFWGRGKYVYV